MAQQRACEALLQQCERGWDRAWQHPFVDAAIDGSLTKEQFDRWLCQDYYFARAFSKVAGAILAAAPDAHTDTLLSGLAALDDELKWFQATAVERGLDLAGTKLQPTAVEYIAFMREMAAAPYAVSATAFWAMELAYNRAWAEVAARATSDVYRTYATRWSSDGFNAYVAALAQHVEEALAAAPGDMAAAGAALTRVADLEEQFWGMAFAA